MILRYFKLLPFYRTGCEEFIDGIFFIVVWLVFLAEIVEKESYHRFIL